MGSNKTVAEKKILAKAADKNRRVPIFVVAKTNRRLSRNPDRRSWRHQKLDMKDLLRKAGASSAKAKAKAKSKK